MLRSACTPALALCAAVVVATVIYLMHSTSTSAPSTAGLTNVGVLKDPCLRIALRQWSKPSLRGKACVTNATGNPVLGTPAALRVRCAAKPGVRIAMSNTYRMTDQRGQLITKSIRYDRKLSWCSDLE